MAGMIKAMDDSVGVILKALQASGQVDNTLVIYVNDNGGTRDNTPFRGRKFHLFEGGIRVPFAMNWPGRIPAGKVYDKPVIQLDILPTVVAAAGGTMPIDREYDGIDLLPYLTGDNSGRPHDALYWRFPAIGRAVRSGDWKLLITRQGQSLLGYVVTDPGETKDLAGEHPERVAQLSKMIEAWEARMDDPKQYGLRKE